mmetsp:Transcript_38466/g.121174  ORF Transcript_38466/g.121174 Transcript_38466/m.121174 type:complete len:153 (+) Transcript_38466:46-504(+)
MKEKNYSDLYVTPHDLCSCARTFFKSVCKIPSTFLRSPTKLLYEGRSTFGPPLALVECVSDRLLDLLPTTPASSLVPGGTAADLRFCPMWRRMESARDVELWSTKLRNARTKDNPKCSTSFDSFEIESTSSSDLTTSSSAPDVEEEEGEEED